MAVTIEKLQAIRVEAASFSYTDRESFLYALSLGFGQDPLNGEELPYVCENEDIVRTVPTMATVLTQFAALRESGIDYSKVLHAEQRLRVLRPLPAAATIVADYGVTAVVDKGPEKGAFIFAETRVRNAADGEPLYVASATILARGDGGIGSFGSAPEALPALPGRAPDNVVSLQSLPGQALLYRLNGDRNPLHSNLAMAARGGFSRPILHGLCTYGMACKAIMASACGYDHTRIEQFDLRFTSPVYPGEQLNIEMWHEGERVLFRCRVPARDAIALNNGICKFRASE
jgi:acyl dehydratase